MPRNRAAIPLSGRSGPPMGHHSGERQFSDLVGSIYDAALVPEGWAAVVAKMKLYLNSPTAQIYNEDVRVRGATFAVMDGLDRSLMDRYYRHYVFLDPNLTAKKKLPVGTVTASNNLMLENQWENTEYYYDFARLAGVFYQLGAYTHRGPGAFGAVGVQRPRSSNPFSRSDIGRMERIVPHLRQAFRTSSLLAGAQGTLAALMELHPHAVFLIDAGGRIVLANRRGEGLLRQRDGFLQVDGRLCATSAGGQEALAGAIHLAVLTGLGTGVHPGQALTIDRPSGASPHQVLVTPLHQPPARFGGGTFQDLRGGLCCRSSIGVGSIVRRIAGMVWTDACGGARRAGSHGRPEREGNRGALGKQLRDGAQSAQDGVQQSRRPPPGGIGAAAARQRDKCLRCLHGARPHGIVRSLNVEPAT